jgi:hypothetical protein
VVRVAKGNPESAAHGAKRVRILSGLRHLIQASALQGRLSIPEKALQESIRTSRLQEEKRIRMPERWLRAAKNAVKEERATRKAQETREERQAKARPKNISRRITANTNTVLIISQNPGRVPSRDPVLNQNAGSIIVRNLSKLNRNDVQIRKTGSIIARNLSGVPKRNAVLNAIPDPGMANNAGQSIIALNPKGLASTSSGTAARRAIATCPMRSMRPKNRPEPKEGRPGKSMGGGAGD